MTIELYHTSHSTCSQKVRLTLAEKGLPERNKDWVEHDVDLNKFEQLTPEYLKLNPNGVVPTLVHDGRALIESSALLEYLDEIIPEPSPWTMPTNGDTKAEKTFEKITGSLKKTLMREIKALSALDPKRLLDERYRKFRQMGEWI